MSSNIMHRLQALPPKVYVPFMNLLSAGQIDEATVSKVLDAGEISGETSKLLGFSTGLLYLKAQHVPVDDVIEMAKKQGRRINLGWSPKRWKEEHDRLSRAETLTRLAEENVQYDVSQYSALLPSNINGYLIRNSRRLGMEGLRQRHCVATYHQQLVSGHCAIACVFIDRVRWTVQLVLTGNADIPLRVAQIKARYNKVPSNDVVKRIHKDLNLKQVTESERCSTSRGEASQTYLDNLRAVLPVLWLHRVERVHVRFDGSGDSGNVDIAEFEPAINTSGIVVSIEKTVNMHIDGTWRNIQRIENVSLEDAIDEIAGAYLSVTGVDWYNNDGGYGDLVIDVAKGTVELEVNVRYTNTDTAFSAIVDIESGDNI